MKANEIRRILAHCDDPDTPIAVPSAILPELNLEDVPEGAVLEIGTMKEGILYSEWSGRLYRKGD